MIVDAKTEMPSAVMKYDVCIVGTGPAGMSLALELQSLRGTICLLEAGDTKPTAESQEFYQGRSVGIPL